VARNPCDRPEAVAQERSDSGKQRPVEPAQERADLESFEAALSEASGARVD
jgi:hypothetical protein